jgi:hypothetical protein
MPWPNFHITISGSADAALWYSHEMSTEYSSAQTAFVVDGVPNRTQASKLPITEAAARVIEMRSYMAVDEQYKDKYYDAAQFYGGINADRHFRFVVRHHLTEQLLHEDAQGMR